MGKLQRIEELTEPPTVGRRYFVPTVLYPWAGVRKEWPVMGPLHEDGEHIGFHADHYHVDVRFVSKSDAVRVSGRCFEDVASTAARWPLATSGEPKHPAPVWKPRICHRAGHAYPYGETSTRGFVLVLRQAYAGRRCGRNAAGMLVCPHRGFVLGSLAPDERGRVVCPLHGLIIDTRTGAVVRPGNPTEARA